MTPILPSNLVINRKELSELLRISESSFDKVRPRLEAHNFPRKLPGMRTWSRPAVEAWIRANGDEEVMATLILGPEFSDKSAQAEEEATGLSPSVLARYGGASA